MAKNVNFLNSCTLSLHMIYNKNMSAENGEKNHINLTVGKKSNYYLEILSKYPLFSTHICEIEVAELILVN